MAVYDMASNLSAKFSNCSVQDLNQALNFGSLQCMYDPPPKAVNLPKLMPGRVQSVDKQCQAHGYIGYCSNERNLCAELWCMKFQGYKLANRCIQTEFSAAPGTPCGNDVNGKPQFCLSQQCVTMD
ncbi:A disintegrin and metalloproteinase with thrombospondin motifs 5-like [Venturia canescens]|uniref:A disintegrin and metalloproteinase with thrombospondin motifs 5-like n=1 Tax=Venturia canescens TaxID=32260 RepID=UPI001C9C98FB|nr:A disintegrin and metalloproteinase with thrombospondin motifs 5-like [Venturia canescens]